MLKRIAPCVVGGLIVSIVIAWIGAIAITRDQARVVQTAAVDALGRGGLRADDGWGACFTTIDTAPSMFFSYVQAQTIPLPHGPRFRWHASVLASELASLASDSSSKPDEAKKTIGAGWPLICLWAQTSDLDPAEESPTFQRGGFVISRSDRDELMGFQVRHTQASFARLMATNAGYNLCILPCIPAWTGLTVNTVFFGLCCWLLMSGFAGWRRARRCRRGLCRTCAYDMTSLPADAPCPECGHTSPRPATPAPPSTTLLHASPPRPDGRA